MNRNWEPVSSKVLLEQLSSLEEVCRYYEIREKKVRDEISRISGAREEGFAQGEVKGKLEGKLEDAQKMLAKGLDEALIIEITGLTPEQIGSLKESLPTEVQ